MPLHRYQADEAWPVIHTQMRYSGIERTSQTTTMQTLSPSKFQALIASGATVLDVRMPEEIAIASLPGAINIPLMDLPDRIGELNPQAPIAVLCHHGVRSEHASRFLEHNGFTQVSHLEGGIDAWSEQIDARVPRY